MDAGASVGEGTGVGAGAGVVTAGAAGLGLAVPARSATSSEVPFPPGESASHAATPTTTTPPATTNPILRTRSELPAHLPTACPAAEAPVRAAAAAADVALFAQRPAAGAAATRRPLRADATAASAALLAQLPAAPPTAAALRSACPIPRATHGATVDPRRSHPRRYAVPYPQPHRQHQSEEHYDEDWNSKDAPLVEDDDERDGRFRQSHYPKELPPG